MTGLADRSAAADPAPDWPHHAFSRFAALPPDHSLVVQISGNPLDCRKECSGLGAQCTEIKADAGTGRSLKKLRAVVTANRTGAIAQRDLLATFDLRADACSRGDTKLYGGRMRNLGSECVLESPIKVGASETKLALEIPRVLDGKWQPNADGVELSFDVHETAPVLRFVGGRGADNLNGLYGGRVTGAGLDAKGARIATESACIMAKLP